MENTMVKIVKGGRKNEFAVLEDYR
jgi:hypothetical protein